MPKSESDAAGGVTLGLFLQQSRRAAQLTQVQLAGLVGVDVMTVSSWERDKWSPNAESILEIQRHLRIQIPTRLIREAQVRRGVTSGTSVLDALERGELPASYRWLMEYLGKLATLGAQPRNVATVRAILTGPAMSALYAGDGAFIDKRTLRWMSVVGTAILDELRTELNRRA